jgi:Baseplate J-like protein
MIYFCCQDRRRNILATQTTLNGIDFLEVLDDPSVPQAQRQRTLFVHFINPLTPASLTASNVRIEGGERIPNIQVTGVKAGSGPQATLLTVTVAAPGDFSTYTLRLIDGLPGSSRPPKGFDPLLSAIDFSFKVACPNDFDCRTAHVCPPSPLGAPEIDYLAKDYASFRQLMLDRISVLSPRWKERNPADIGIALVELLAYAGDYLSYRQDAIATEAYLGTARRRVSIRRHARLVDYRIREGTNARVWVHVRVTADTIQAHPNDPSPLPAGTRVATSIPGQKPRIPTNAPRLEQLLDQALVVFEIMEPAPAGLYLAHNEIQFYTWGALECCLPKGATRATLAGAFPNLKKGNVLIFEEVLGPATGDPADADHAHRCAVRLVGDAIVTQDPLGGLFATPPNNNPVDITEIEWGAADALPFCLCISSKTDQEHGQNLLSSVSVAHGNIVLADHGRTITGEQLQPVPQPALILASPPGDRCNPQQPQSVPARYRPALSKGPLTQVTPLAGDQSPASSVLIGDPAAALPAILLTDSNGRHWNVRSDLLASDPLATDFVVETEDDQTAALRFGDDTNGIRPATGTSFSAAYRIGNGTAGNVGTDTLAHVVSDNPNIERVRNPLPSLGGTEPESIEDVRQHAPNAFRTQERAVTVDDYAQIAERHPEVQRAAASFRWTGSWRTVFIAVDRLGGLPMDDAFETTMRQYFDPFRMAGHDIEIDEPHFVALEIEMVVFVGPEHFRSDVELALLNLFNNRVAPDGTLGVFHPDNFTFGQTVYSSPIYAAALKLDGISSVQITTFQRQGEPASNAAPTGALPMDRLEIARLDNDPNFPEHGVFRLIMMGGK